MIDSQSTPFWTHIFRCSVSRDRLKITNSVISGLKNESLAQDVKRGNIGGISYGLEFLKDNKVKAFIFDIPAVVYSSKKYPAVFLVGPEINKNLKIVNTKDEKGIKERHSWVDILKKANANEKSRIKNEVLKGMEYFNAKWKKDSNQESGYRLLSKDSDVVKFKNSLKTNKSLKFEGFCPNCIYMRIKGNAEQLAYDWVHPFSAPTLLFSHKKVPIYIIAGLNIMYNDSIIRENADNQIYEPVFGFTG